MNLESASPRPFEAMVPACAKRGIGRTVAFDLQRKGLIETFHIGSKSYVFIDSLDTLHERLPKRAAVKRRTA